MNINELVAIIICLIIIAIAIIWQHGHPAPISCSTENVKVANCKL
jgi:hypothetical protein